LAALLKVVFLQHPLDARWKSQDLQTIQRDTLLHLTIEPIYNELWDLIEKLEPERNPLALFGLPINKNLLIHFLEPDKESLEPKSNHNG